MSNQPSTKSKSMTRTFLVPLAEPLLKGANKVGDVAQGGVLMAVEKFGVDGSGVRISKHWGIAAENAAKASLGGGPLKDGGHGMAGGDAKLEMIRFGTACVIVVGAVGGVLLVDYLAAKEPDEKTATSTCQNCLREVPDSLGDGEALDPAASCPHCGHLNSNDA